MSRSMKTVFADIAKFLECQHSPAAPVCSSVRRSFSACPRSRSLGSQPDPEAEPHIKFEMF